MDMRHDRGSAFTVGKVIDRPITEHALQDLMILAQAREEAKLTDDACI
jgi:hypothetical protein